MHRSSATSEVIALVTHQEYPAQHLVLQPPPQRAPSSSPDFRIPNTPPAMVTSSTCSPPAPQIMRPPPPPPPPHLKFSRSVVHCTQESKLVQHHEEPSSSIPDLEFDGTTVLCRVCGDKASGFHYGVHSCEGCKGFFRRSIQQKIQYRPCTKNQQCSILRINRNRCQYCRLKKCIAVGMSRDAVRFGRVPKREKARILAAMQQSTNSRSQEKALSAELEDDQRLLNTVVKAHMETCDFTRDKVQPMLLQARTHPSFTSCPPTLACPLNPNPQPLSGQQELLQDFSKRFSPAIRGVVEFAKRITGFSLLPQDDQVTLLKAGVFEVLLVRLACMFDSQTNSMICLNGQVLKRESIHNSSNARFLMDSMFDFAERLNSLCLSDAEIGLFSSVVVIAPDRPGLRNVELIEKMHNKLKALLQTVLSQNHPTYLNLCQELMKKIPDLRTLNTLHSEKLLAFKMTEQQQQQQHYNLWDSVKFKTEPQSEGEYDGKSPVGSSSWSSSSDAVAMEEVKSPMGSVSSTESACSGEVASLGDATATVMSQSHHHYPHHNGVSLAVTAPLLAATLASGGTCPVRHHRDNSASDEEPGIIHPAAVQRQTPVVRGKEGGGGGFRKLDSPSDSGIESGTEKIEKVTVSAPTSVCSSPRSLSIDEREEHHHTRNIPATIIPVNGHHHNVEDMPVLKRVLQAPPLYDTNSLMDEAYKPHKKFRALRNKDSIEAEPLPLRSPGSSSIVISPPVQSLGSSHLQYHLTSMGSSLMSPTSSVNNNANATPSSTLSSTHSTLAKSLMEGPRMTPEQIKRTDIIHNFIMRGADNPLQTHTTPVSYLHQSHHHVPTQYIPAPQASQMQQHKWDPNNGMISGGIRTSPYSSNFSSAPAATHVLPSEQHTPRIYVRSPNISPSACSPSLHYMPSSSHHPPATSPVLLSPTGHLHHLSTTVTPVLMSSTSQQPLNLSKKTPPSSPRPLSTPKAVTMEA